MKTVKLNDPLGRETTITITNPKLNDVPNNLIVKLAQKISVGLSMPTADEAINHIAAQDKYNDLIRSAYKNYEVNHMSTIEQFLNNM